MRYIHFVWNEEKSRANAKKHGVSFEEARSAFFDDNARLMDDPDHSSNKDRFLLLGISVRLRLLLVCHCTVRMKSKSESFRPVRQRNRVNPIWEAIVCERNTTPGP